jgi:hypothetical protein
MPYEVAAIDTATWTRPLPTAGQRDIEVELRAAL